MFGFGQLIDILKKNPKKIVFTEGEDPRILEAASRLLASNFLHPILVGKPDTINAKAEEVSQKISRGGKIIPCDGGAIWLKRGQPFAQNMGDENDDLIKRKYLNITAEFITAD